MLLKEYKQTEDKLTKLYLYTQPSTTEKSILNIILELLIVLKDLLFINGKFEPIKFYQFARIYKIAAATVNLIKQLVTAIK